MPYNRKLFNEAVKNWSSLTRNALITLFFILCNLCILKCLQAQIEEFILILSPSFNMIFVSFISFEEFVLILSRSFNMILLS
jgi:hypothetical protein